MHGYDMMPHVEIREGILDPLGVRVRKKELLMDNVVGLTIVVVW